MCPKTLNTINDCCDSKKMVDKTTCTAVGSAVFVLENKFKGNSLKQTREIELDLIPVGDLYSRLPFTLIQPS